MFAKTRIRKHEVGLWFRHGDFKRPLGPGVHWLFTVPFGLLGRNRVQVVNVLEPRFEHPMLDVMIDSDELRSMLEVVDLGDTERALVWQDGRHAKEQSEVARELAAVRSEFQGLKEAVGRVESELRAQELKEAQMHEARIINLEKWQGVFRAKLGVEED